MKSVQPHYEGAAKTVRMDAARYRDPEKGDIIIRPQGYVLKRGEEHYSVKKHKGHLCCLDCDAKVSLRPGADTAIMGSSLKGPDPHFALNRGQMHNSECEYSAAVRKKSSAPKKVINTEKGFVIHIDTQAFNFFTRREGVYRRDGAIIRTEDEYKEDLEDREKFPIHSIKDIVRLLETEDPERTKKSVVVFNNELMPWNKFFVRYNHKGIAQPRFMDLFSRLKEAGPEGQVFCLMEFQVRKPRYGDWREKHRPVQSRSIPYLRMDDGSSRDIIPGALIDYEAHSGFRRMAFSTGKKYLALGLVSLNDTGDGPFYLNMHITHPDGLAAVDIEEIAQTVKARLGDKPDNGNTPSSP